MRRRRRVPLCCSFRAVFHVVECFLLMSILKLSSGCTDYKYTGIVVKKKNEKKRFEGAADWIVHKVWLLTGKMKSAIFTHLFFVVIPSEMNFEKLFFNKTLVIDDPAGEVQQQTEWKRESTSDSRSVASLESFCRAGDVQDIEIIVLGFWRFVQLWSRRSLWKSVKKSDFRSQNRSVLSSCIWMEFPINQID